MELISMQGVTKIYRTKEIETVALEGVNLDAVSYTHLTLPTKA